MSDPPQHRDAPPASPDNGDAVAASTSPPREVDLAQRVEQLEQRIAMLEARWHAASPRPSSPVASPVAPLPFVPPSAPPSPAPATTPPGVLTSLVERKQAARERAGVGAPQTPPVTAPAAASPAMAPRVAPQPETLPYQPTFPPPPPVAEGGLEQTIGLKWAGWIGALVVVFGAVLGVKYAIDAGWIGQLPAEVRLLLMALGGFGLIAAGEVVYRKVNRVSAAGLFAAGVATLFLVSYAGYGFLDVYGQNLAFALMALTTLVGAAVAVRGRLVSVAVLALLGGQLTPLILGGETSTPVPLLSYLLMLQVVALVLAWWGGTTKWWTLRWLSLVTTSLWLTAVLLHEPYRQHAASFAFLLTFAGLFLAELIVSALRPRGAADRVDQGAGVAFSLAISAALVLGTLLALQDVERMVRGAWIVAYAAAYVLSGFALRRAAAGQMLAIALRTQAAALLVVAVPVALSGAAVVLVWLGMAIGFGVVGARLNLVISRVASAATWIAAIAYLLLAVQSAEIPPDSEQIAFTVRGTAVPLYVLLGWITATAGLAVAWLLTTRAYAPVSDSHDVLSTEEGPAVAAEPVAEPGWSLAAPAEEFARAGRVLAAVAGAVWLAASFHGLPPAAATLAFVGWAWLLVAIGVAAPGVRLGLGLQALLVLVLAAVKWATLDLLAQRLGLHGWTSAQLGYRPMLNPLMALGSLIAGSLAAAYWLRRREINSALDRVGGTRSSVTSALVVATVVILVITFGLTLEIDRVVESAVASGWTISFRPAQIRLLAFTVLWCFAAMAMAGLVIRLEPDLERRRARMTPLAWIRILLVAKFLLIDTIAFHVFEGRLRGSILLNPETAAAIVVLANITLSLWGLRVPEVIETTGSGALQRHVRRSVTAAGLGVAGLLVVLMVGQWEIGRVMNYLNVTPLARGVAVSVWWSLFAVATVAAGFVTRIRGLRYFGLALLAITLVKVFIIDLQTLDRGWRTLSFIALGLLLLGTSVLYGKFSPKLLREK